MYFSERAVLYCFALSQKKLKKETGLPRHGADGNIHFAFEVSKDAYAETLQQVKNSGIEILHEHLWKNELRSFYFHDPDNNVVEIIEQGLWEQ